MSRGRRPTGADEMRTDAVRELRTHVCSPGSVRSFHFVRENEDTNHWFDLTWTPGSLTLSGDIGTMILTHYSALREFESGIRWAANSTYDYLIEKSSENSQELDSEATLAYIWEAALEGPIDTRQAERLNRRILRAENRVARAEWDIDIEYWQASQDGPAPLLADYVQTVEDALPPLEFRPAADIPGARRSYSSKARWEPPEGWELLYAIWEHFDWGGGDPRELLTHEGRQEVYEELASALGPDATEDSVAELCQSIDLDDYYGAYRYRPRTVWQIEAVRHGCSLILDQLDPSRTWGKSWADPVL